MGTPVADNRKQKAFEQQQIYDNEVENEQSEESDSFSDFDKLDGARENLMTSERDGHVSFEEVETVTEYIDLKLTQEVSRQDLAKRLRS